MFAYLFEGETSKRAELNDKDFTALQHLFLLFSHIMW